MEKKTKSKTNKKSLKGSDPVSREEHSVEEADIAYLNDALAAAEIKAGMLDIIPTPVMAIDKDFTVTYINSAGASTAGKTPGSCLGQKCFNLFNTNHCNTPDCQLA